MTDITIHVSEPALVGREREYLNQCLDQKQLSGGSFLRRFEIALAERHEVAHAVACMNGTVALHLALMGMNLKPGDEVIMPSLTYVATANAVAYCGATPVFAEIDPFTWNMQPGDVAQKITRRTVGILPVHLFGNPCDMQAIMDIARLYKLWIVEDAAEALGGKYGGYACGTMSDAGIFSFYGNKTITCGEGGAVLTNSQRIADRMRLRRGQGQSFARRYWHEVLGYNYRMTNLQAALGLAQFECLPWHLNRRRFVFDTYNDAFRSIGELQRQITTPDATHANWMYSVLLPSAEKRDRLMANLLDVGIETRPFFTPMHLLPMYERPIGVLPITEDVAARGLNLPTHAGLSSEDLNNVINAVLGYL